MLTEYSKWILHVFLTKAHPYYMQKKREIHVAKAYSLTGYLKMRADWPAIVLSLHHCKVWSSLTSEDLHSTESSFGQGHRSRVLNCFTKDIFTNSGRNITIIAGSSRSSSLMTAYHFGVVYTHHYWYTYHTVGIPKLGCLLLFNLVFPWLKENLTVACVGPEAQVTVEPNQYS